MPLRQKPFSFQNDRWAKKAAILNRAHRTQFSRNIIGLCAGFAHPHQKIRKEIEVVKDGKIVKETLPFDPCKRCTKSGYNYPILELPENLRPWKVIDATKKVHANYYYVPFTCNQCFRKLPSFSVFGAICNHQKHVPPEGYVCRFCCSKVDDTSKVDVESDTPATIRKLRREKKKALRLARAREPRILRPGDIQGLINWQEIEDIHARIARHEEQLAAPIFAPEPPPGYDPNDDFDLPYEDEGGLLV